MKKLRDAPWCPSRGHQVSTPESQRSTIWEGLIGSQWQDFHHVFRSFHAVNWLKRVVKTFLPPVTKLGQGNNFRSVCQEFCSQRGVWYPSMHCKSPGWHPGGSWWVWPGGSPGQHPVGWEGSRPKHRRVGGLQAHTWGNSRHTPRGIPACTEADTPLSPANSYCCRQYTSYWMHSFCFV